MRVGIIKGAFAPLLCSQLSEILKFRKQYSLDEIWFVFEEHTVSYENRSHMLKLMIAPYRKLKIMKGDWLYEGIDYVQLPFENIEFDFDLHWKDVSSVVKTYMMEHGIYVEDIARSLVKPKRWLHVSSMTQLAVDLAVSHHMNAYEAFLAGMFHDCTKKLDYDESSFWMRLNASNKLDEAFAIHHQYTGEIYCRRVLKIRNQNVLHAILHHVKGDSNHPLAQIIYLADKLDPSRDYDSSKEIALAKKDLNQAMKVVKEQQIAYLRKEGVDV